MHKLNSISVLELSNAEEDNKFQHFQPIGCMQHPSRERLSRRRREKDR
jgi:hypothetical protein